MHRGYIKLWRKVEDSFLMLDSEAFHLWFVLLMLANHQDKEHLFNAQKVIIKRGQLISGRHSLSDRTSINESKVYRLLELFEHEQLIEQQKNNRYSIISILNYNEYQSNEQQNEQPVNNQRTTSEQPVNTPKELISIKNELKNIKNNIPPAIEEVKKYCLERNNQVDVQKWHDFYTSKGWMIGKNKMKDWKAAVRTWEKSDKKETGDESYERLQRERAEGDEIIRKYREGKS